MPLSTRMAAILLILSTPLAASDLSIGPPVELTTRTESVAQNDPAIAWSGERAVVVWSEQRAGDTAPQIYALTAGVTGDGVAITSGSTRHEVPRVAWDGHRFLATWWQDDFGGTIAGRFLSPDGTPDGNVFAIAESSRATFDLAWSGIEYVVAWTRDGSIHAARVTPLGSVATGGSAGSYESTGRVRLAAGAGRVVAIFAAPTAAAWQVESAIIGQSISLTGTVASASRACSGLPKGCLYGAEPTALAWNGRDFLAITKIQNHPAYGYALNATPIAIDGTPLTSATRSLRRASMSEGTAGEGALVATGADYYLALPTPGYFRFWNAWLRADGTPVNPDGVYVSQPVNGRPAAVLVAPRRVLLVTGNVRLVIRVIVLPPDHKRRRAASH